MGGRGSAGGTRSTYRGGDTLDFLNRGLNGNGNPLPDTSNNGGGSGKKGDKKTGTGAKTNSDNGGGGKGDGGGSTVEEKKDQPTTDVNDQQDLSSLTDEELKELFVESTFFDELISKYPEDPRYGRNYPIFYKRWLESEGIKAPYKEEKPEPESKPPGVMDYFRRVDKLPETEQEWRADLKTVNPHWNDPDYNVVNGSDVKARLNIKNRINCQRCVVAQEAREKGYDVTAVSIEEGWKPGQWIESINRHNSHVVGATSSDIASLFIKSDGTHPSWSWGTPGNDKGVRAAAMEAEILSWGEGARGIVFVNWSNGRGAHVFSAKVQNGQVVYLDPQTGEYGNELTGLNNNWKLKIDPTKTHNGVLRVDNTEFTSNAATWMRSRYNEQINVPTQAELTAHIDKKTPQEQIIWGHVWQQVAAGDPVSLPATLPPSLAPLTRAEVTEIAREAAAWARRPD